MIRLSVAPSFCESREYFLCRVYVISGRRFQKRTTVLAAAGRVGDFSQAMIQTIEEPSEEIKEFQDNLVQLAKSVATSTAQLVLR